MKKKITLHLLTLSLQGRLKVKIASHIEAASKNEAQQIEVASEIEAPSQIESASQIYFTLQNEAL